MQCARDVRQTSDRQAVEDIIVHVCAIHKAGGAAAAETSGLVTFNELWIAEINNDREVTEKLDARYIFPSS